MSLLLFENSKDSSQSSVQGWRTPSGQEAEQPKGHQVNAWALKARGLGTEHQGGPWVVRRIRTARRATNGLDVVEYSRNHRVARRALNGLEEAQWPGGR